MAGRVCQVLQSSPQEFGSLELKVTEAKEAVDVAHADASFLILSCLDEKGAMPPPRFACVYAYMYIQVIVDMSTGNLY